MPFAPGKLPRRLSKLRFSKYNMIMFFTFLNPSSAAAG
jgi:hypothetical protein